VLLHSIAFGSLLPYVSAEGERVASKAQLEMSSDTMAHSLVYWVQDLLGREILIENISSYLRYEGAEMPEWEFLAALSRMSGCGLLVDVNNIYVSAANHDFDPEAYLRARLPAAQLTRADHAPMVSQQVTALPATSDEWNTAFSRILGELDDLYLLENATSRTLYYGFIPKRTSGIAGTAYRPGNAAVGFDLPSNPTAVRETMVHEIGHNLSLRHAPCGNPSSPDPNYPYANAAMGAGNRFIWGFDATSNRFVDPTPDAIASIRAIIGRLPAVESIDPQGETGVVPASVVSNRS